MVFQIFTSLNLMPIVAMVGEWNRQSPATKDTGG